MARAKYRHQRLLQLISAGTARLHARTLPDFNVFGGKKTHQVTARDVGNQFAVNEFLLVTERFSKQFRQRIKTECLCFRDLFFGGEFSGGEGRNSRVLVSGFLGLLVAWPFGHLDF